MISEQSPAPQKKHSLVVSKARLKGSYPSWMQTHTWHTSEMEGKKTTTKPNRPTKQNKTQNTKDIPFPSICQLVYLPVLKLLGREHLQNTWQIANAITNKAKSKPTERAQEQGTGNQAPLGLCQCHPMSLDTPLLIQVCFHFVFHIPTIFFFPLLRLDAC